MINNNINNNSGNAIDAEAKWKNTVQLIKDEDQNVENLKAAILKGVTNKDLSGNYDDIYNHMLKLFTKYKDIINSIKDTKYNKVLFTFSIPINKAVSALDDIEKKLETYTAEVVDVKDKDDTLDAYDEINKTIDSFKDQCKKCKDILNSFTQATTSKKQVITIEDAEQKWNNFIKIR